MNNWIIHLRDANGRWFCIKGLKKDIYDFCKHMVFEDTPEEYEIQLVIVDGVCIYSALANDEIDFEDLLGFVA